MKLHKLYAEEKKNFFSKITMIPLTDMVSSNTESDRQQNIAALKERLLSYKLKNELLIQQEIEHEAQLLKSKHFEEEEKIRLEQERQHLLEELQRMSG
ncbi:hypothetical protein BD560DRAFT_379834 [Blakeslea trispora]|nr:hypothetical protein BD560DRAFT_379834 [Blakeslea trispora]